MGGELNFIGYLLYVRYFILHNLSYVLETLKSVNFLTLHREIHFSKISTLGSIS